MFSVTLIEVKRQNMWSRVKSSIQYIFNVKTMDVDRRGDWIAENPWTVFVNRIGIAQYNGLKDIRLSS